MQKNKLELIRTLKCVTEKDNIKLNKKGVGKIIIYIGLIIVLAVVIYILFFNRYNGTWEMKGYGLTMKIQNGFVKTYEVTESYYCQESEYDGFIFSETFFSGMGKFRLEKTDNQLEIIDSKAQVTYNLTKCDASFLDSKIKVDSGMQVEKFGMFYEMFKENYAFQTLYQVDLANQFQKLKLKVTEGTTDKELFGYMSELISNLKDGHVVIDWNGQSFCPVDIVPLWMSEEKQMEVLSKLIINKYVLDYKKFEDCPIRYGYLSERLGYIVIHGMGVEAFEKSKSTKDAMDQIISEFNEKNVEKIAIELRFNGGGFDEASLCLAGYFTDKKYLAYKKQAFVKGDFTTLQEVYVTPQMDFFDGEVYVLTSGYTISAAETFLRALLANEKNKVTVVGEKTAGFYSDAIMRSLPDGFTYALSNERYIWYNGEMLEGKGVLPHVVIPVSMESVYRGTEEALDWILGSDGN